MTRSPRPYSLFPDMRCADPFLWRGQRIVPSQAEKWWERCLGWLRGGRIWKNLAENPALAPLAVREIERADSSNPYEHENGGEQDDYDQGSLLVLQYVGSNSIAKP